MNSVLIAPGLSPATAREIENALPGLERDGQKIYDRKNQQVYRFQAADLDLVAKTYQIQTVSRFLAACLGFSRARRSFRAALLLEKAGIKTPRPILVKEEGRFLNSSSTLVTEYCHGQSLRTILQQGKPTSPDLPKELAEIIARLVQHNLRHGDFHDANFILSSDGHPWLIDLDGARKRFLKTKARRNIREDRDRLLLSINHSPGFQASLIAKVGAPGSPLP